MPRRSSIPLKILAAIGPAFLILLAALGLALHQMHGSVRDFGDLLDRDLARVQVYDAMYDQGMQGGQAIRNLMLDTADGEARNALAQANGAFRKALKQAMDTTSPGSDRQAVLVRLDAQWEALEGLRDMYVETVDVQADTRERFVREETPLWRDIRSTLLQLRAEEVGALQSARAATQERARTAMRLGIGMAIVATLLGLGLTQHMMRGVRKTLASLRDSMEGMAQGGGNLQARLAVAGADEVGQTSRAFNAFLDGLRGLVLQTRTHAHEVGEQMRGASRHVEQVTAGSREQSEAAGAVAAAVEELSVAIASVAGAADEVRRLSESSVERTERSQGRLRELADEIAQVQAAVQEIEATTRRFLAHTVEITNMTHQVQEVADQTNLLALNASIEAARAGEYGRGFAVVADEVRRLAEQSGASADLIDSVTRRIESEATEVSQAIRRGAQAIATSVAALDEVRLALDETRTAARRSGDGVANIADSVSEQHAASQDIARHVERIAQMAESNQQAVDRTLDAIRHMDGLVGELNRSFGQFQA